MTGKLVIVEVQKLIWGGPGGCSLRDHRGDLGVLGGGGGSSSPTRGSSNGEVTHSRNWPKLLKELRLPSNPLTICLWQGFKKPTMCPTVRISQHKKTEGKKRGRWGKKYMVSECFFN